MEPIFTEKLKKFKQGEKMYSLNQEQIEDILKLRGKKTELDPGMGGVSPKKLDDLLNTSSELVSVDLAITSGCNFKCIWCYRPGEEWGKLKLNFDKILNVVEESAELGVRFFVLTGGEPLMYKDGDKNYFDVVDKILDIYNKKGMDVNILTFSDVALIDKDAAKKLAERKVGLCLKRDSLDHRIQDSIVGINGGSRKIEEGYKNLFEVGYGSDPKLPVSVNTVLAKNIPIKNDKINTLDDLIDLHRWIRKNGMEHSIVPIHYCGEAEEEEQNQGIHPLEIKAVYDILAEIDRREFDDKWEVYSPFPKNKTCNRPGRGVHIRATGKVTACSESPLTKNYIFGDIKETGLKDIIRSKEFQSFKEEFKDREGAYICNPDVCDLNANYLCRGGCATRSAYSKIDPETGYIVQNTDMQSYSEGREDPLCPGWAVIAQKQGILREGLYEGLVNGLISKSKMPKKLGDEIKETVISKFNKLKNAI